MSSHVIFHGGDTYLCTIHTKCSFFSISGPDGPLPSVMQEVDLPVINNTACEDMYKDAGYVEHIPNIFICAGYAAGGKDSCEVT